MENTPQSSDDVHDHASGVEEKPVDLMEVFSRQLEDIISTYGSACNLMEEKLSILEEDEEKQDKEMVARDLGVNTRMSSSPETEQTARVLLEGLGEEASLVLGILNDCMSPEEKLEMVLRKYAELLKEQRGEQVALKFLQKRQDVLIKQRDQLHLEHSRGILARCKLENLCRQLHKHSMTLKDDMLQKCQEDERKRAEISSHFQNTVLDIQAQIEQHSNHNNKLCQENSELANKLTSIIQQYEKREESLEKIFKQKNLQQQLSDAKLEEANMLLKEEEEKHKREKEYLLKDAIEKTKKCCTMKEQELQMKKQLVLYSQKFDEFQATLAKSNDVYATFKQEMEKMTKKMKKLEKESNVWKIRFESCNKALTDMIEERREKGKELEMFTLKIAKLETLCRALQEERKVLYEKIKEIRMQTLSASETVMEIGEEIPELAQLPVSEPVHNPALTAEMEKLWKEQTRLQEFAASLITSTADEMGGSDSEEEPSELTQLVPLVPVPSKPPMVKVDPISEEQSLKSGKEEVSKSETMLTSEAVTTQAIQFQHKDETSQQEKEPLKAESPTEEPPKVEPANEEPPKVEPSNEEPPNEEPSNEEPYKVEPSNEEPPKIEPHTVEPFKKEIPSKVLPKEELSNMEPFKEPSKEQLSREEPSKVEFLKGEPPKVESTRVKPSKVESLKEEPPKVPTKNVDKVRSINQDTPSQKPNKPKPADQKQIKSKEVKRVTVQSKTSEVNFSKRELHTEQEPKTECTKAGSTEVEPIQLKSHITDAPETSIANAEKPQNIQSQGATPSANKPHPKKQGSSKKKGGAAKSVKKS